MTGFATRTPHVGTTFIKRNTSLYQIGNAVVRKRYCFNGKKKEGSDARWKGNWGSRKNGKLLGGGPKC